MTSAPPEFSKLQLSGALVLVAQIVQARAMRDTGDPNGTVHVDRRVCLQAAADLPPNPRFDRNAWVKAWQAAREDGSLPARKAVYRLLCQTLADELDFDGDSWEGEHEQAEFRRIASHLRSVDTKVCIDDMLGPLDAKVDPHNLWNGFVSPRFTLDAARELADQTQRLAEECGADGVDTVHVIDAGGKDRDGKPLAFVLRVSWMYLEEEGAKQATLIIEPDDEGRYSIGGWEWCWSYAAWWCLCSEGHDWHVPQCEGCGMTREQSETLKEAAPRVGEILHRLAPEATALLFEADGAPRIVGVVAGETELNIGDGGPFDTETLGEADAALQAALGGGLTDSGPHWLRFTGHEAH
ncbi:hypothetical protein [Streptomyces mirabilis]|uniref:hypothetical protein n=1 Tax=Streptomyces mirabilis TaxID=68239 RepID=UPI00224D5A5D|nr:hypothetical protein [Streptomyces mirabilis]MCX4609433.1 hypothetical protein [Streptomyces mirabilis]